MNAEYKQVQIRIMEQVERIAKVTAPAADYLEALGEIKDEIDSWFEASMDAARDDVKREEDES